MTARGRAPRLGPAPAPRSAGRTASPGPAGRPPPPAAPASGSPPGRKRGSTPGGATVTRSAGRPSMLTISSLDDCERVDHPAAAVERRRHPAARRPRPAGPASRAAPSATSRRGRGGGRRSAGPGTTGARRTACRSRSRPAPRRTAPAAGRPSAGGRREDRVAARPAVDPVAVARATWRGWPRHRRGPEGHVDPAAAHRLATRWACTSDPPASGSSRSRQATKRTRRRPTSPAMAASSAGPVGAGSADRLGDGTSTGATGRRRTDGASARSSGVPQAPRPLGRPPGPRRPGSRGDRPRDPLLQADRPQSSRPDTRDGRTPPRRGAVVGGRRGAPQVGRSLRWWTRAKPIAAAGPTPPGPRGRPGPWPVAPRGRPPPPRWPPPHPPPAGR